MGHLARVIGVQDIAIGGDIRQDVLIVSFAITRRTATRRVLGHSTVRLYLLKFGLPAFLVRNEIFVIQECVHLFGCDLSLFELFSFLLEFLVAAVQAQFALVTNALLWKQQRCQFLNLLAVVDLLNDHVAPRSHVL